MSHVRQCLAQVNCDFSVIRVLFRISTLGRMVNHALSSKAMNRAVQVSVAGCPSDMPDLSWCNRAVVFVSGRLLHSFARRQNGFYLCSMFTSVCPERGW